MDSLERLNNFYSLILGKPLIPEEGEPQPSIFPKPEPPPSLEAMLTWAKQHREMQATTNLTFQIADVIVESIEELRAKS